MYYAIRVSHALRKQGYIVNQMLEETITFREIKVKEERLSEDWYYDDKTGYKIKKKLQKIETDI